MKGKDKWSFNNLRARLCFGCLHCLTLDDVCATEKMK